jgi:hypothetical protein
MTKNFVKSTSIITVAVFLVLSAKSQPSGPAFRQFRAKRPSDLKHFALSVRELLQLDSLLPPSVNTSVKLKIWCNPF